MKIETLAQAFSCEFCEISKNSFSYRTPPVAASENCSDQVRIQLLLTKFTTRKIKFLVNGTNLKTFTIPVREIKSCKHQKCDLL